MNDGHVRRVRRYLNLEGVSLPNVPIGEEITDDAIDIIGQHLTQMHDIAITKEHTYLSLGKIYRDITILLLRYGMNPEALLSTIDDAEEKGVEPDINLLVETLHMSERILTELSRIPISYQALWEQIGRPIGTKGKAFDNALQHLVSTGKASVNPDYGQGSYYI